MCLGCPSVFARRTTVGGGSLSFVVATKVLNNVFAFSISPRLTSTFSLDNALNTIVNNTRRCHRVSTCVSRVGGASSNHGRCFRTLVGSLNMSSGSCCAHLLSSVVKQLARNVNTASPSVCGGPCLCFLGTSRAFGTSYNLNRMVAIGRKVFGLSRGVSRVTIIVTRRVNRKRGSRMLRNAQGGLGATVNDAVLTNTVNKDTFSSGTVKILARRVGGIRVAGGTR